MRWRERMSNRFWHEKQEGQNVPSADTRAMMSGGG